MKTLIGLQGKNYWQRERLICFQLAKEDWQEAQNKFTLDELHAASESKSFDYRLLNLLLFALRGVEPDRNLMQFLFVDEHLVDIGDDLLDYEASACILYHASLPWHVTRITLPKPIATYLAMLMSPRQCLHQYLEHSL